MTIHINRAISDVYPAASTGNEPGEEGDQRWIHRQQFNDMKKRCEEITARLRAEDFED